MTLTRAGDWLLYRSVEALFAAYRFLQLNLPEAVFRRLAAATLKNFVRLLLPRRRIIKNITRAYGKSYSPHTKEGLARGVQDNFARSLIDCFLQLGDPARARRKITIEGLEHLQAALAKGNGVIALGAHIGNFVMVGTRLGMEGYTVSTLFRMPPDRRLKSLIERLTPSFYQQVIPSRPRQAAIRRIALALRRNEIVSILGDNLKSGKVETSFFGRRVHTARGPASLALRSGAALVPMYLVRTYGGKLRLIIEPALLLIREGNVYEDVTGNTRRIVGHLETLIGRYPDQWNWLTVRLKKPRGAAAEKKTPDQPQWIA
jgi:lauroyl/myristoyl acyltransferase